MRIETSRSRWTRAAVAVLVGVAVVGGALLGIRRLEERRAAEPGTAPSTAAELAPAHLAAGTEPMRVSLSGGTNTWTPNALEITQTISLRAGWNAIYLEVEPRNTSPLVNVDLDGDGNMISRTLLSTVESVFEDIEPSLVSVWEWRTPVSTKDFLADPSEGLWDEPGWRKYYPASSPGPDGEPREFLNDLYNLHAGRAYLVEMAAPETLHVVGDPAVTRPRREVGAYNLGGFPIEPSVSVDANGYVTPLLSIDEVHEIEVDGTWRKIWDRSVAGGNASPPSDLKYGEGYLLRIAEPGGSGTPDLFTKNALLDIEVTDDRLDFSDQFVALADQQYLTLRNRNSGTLPATVEFSLLTAGSPVEIEVEEPPGSDNWAKLGSTAASISIDPGATKNVPFRILHEEQEADGASLIEVASTDLGTRWFVQASAESASRFGLWVGDVYVTEVSEGRAGSTNIENARLAIGLSADNDSGIRGSVQMVEITPTMATSFLISLQLPDASITRPTGLDEPVDAWVGGWFFEDRSANGEYDGNEPGFEGFEVKLADGSDTFTTTTESDGSWVIDNGGAGLPDGDYTITYTAPSPTTLLSYTQDFDIVMPDFEESGESVPTPIPSVTPPPEPPPVTEENRWPTRVEISGGEVVEWDEWEGATTVTLVPDPDPDGGLQKPSLDFGWVTEYDAFLGRGTCSDIVAYSATLGVAVNGRLEVTRASTVIQEPPNFPPPDYLLETTTPWFLQLQEKQTPPDPDAGTSVVCGDIRVGKPTAAPFDFRVLMRVTEQSNGLAKAELLPHYDTAEGGRVTSINSSIVQPVERTEVNFVSGETVEFRITIDYRDPLNPFKHKYHPDFDNLDVKFNAINPNAVPPYQWEVPEIRRIMKFTPTSDAPDALGLSDAISGWGGTVWGGDYEEILKGVHKEEITVRGAWVVRRLRTAAQLNDPDEQQDYD